MTAAKVPSAEWHALSGWGMSVHRLAEVVRPRTAEELAGALAQLARAGRRVVMRGAGRSYGDAALPTDRVVLDTSALRSIGEVDPETATITVGPGVTIADLWQAVLPQGYWLPVVPGTMRPTVGGCVAMNVHGKNQFAVGPIGEHVTRLMLVLADGSERVVDPERDAELFHAVVGGAGLLGVITSVTLRLKPITSGFLDVVARPHVSLEGVARTFEDRKDDAEYLVGWIDAFHPRARGVTHEASAVDDSSLGGLSLADQELPARLFGVMPRDKVAALIGLCAGPRRMSWINQAKYRSAAWRGEHRFRQGQAAFHFLLDYVPGWKAIYAPGGMIQHQSFVPRDEGAGVHHEVMALCRRAEIVPWLAVYKRHRADAFLLSHNVDGYSLALDFPVTPSNRLRLWELCEQLDRAVRRGGGTFYFAKDATAAPDMLAECYPGLPRFREWKRELDPDGMFVSALAVRLGMVDVSDG